MRRDRTYPCRHIWFLLVLLAVLAAVVTAGLACGSASFSLRQLAGGFLRESGYETEAIILYKLRLPRVAAGMLAGVGLSVAGVLLQAMTNNALASPNVIGVNAGAGFCVILCLCFFPSAFAVLPLAAFIGAFATTLFIVTVSGRAKARGSRCCLRVSPATRCSTPESRFCRCCIPTSWSPTAIFRWADFPGWRWRNWLCRRC